MMAKVKDILDVIDKMAPFSSAESWDNPGLQVGYYSQEVARIMTALDPSIQSLREAVEKNAQLLLTHHPLIFHPLSSVNPETYPGDVINEALLKKISIIAIHTNLDTARGGMNDILAELLGLKEVEVLEEKDGQEGIGLGRIGTLPEGRTFSTIIKEVKKALNSPSVMVTGPKDMEIRRIAIVGGSGGGLVSLSSKKGADLLITGDITHHQALEAKALGLALVDGRHFQTEWTALKIFSGRLGDRLKDMGMDIMVESFGTEEDPMRYE